MNTFKDIENNIESHYSLEDSLLGVVNDLQWEMQEMMSKNLLNCFTKFIDNKNIVLDEIEKELINKNIDKDLVAFIIEKINSIIFSHYDYENEEDLY